MVSSLTQNKFFQLIKTLIKGEQEIESARLDLARNPSFESYTAFKRIDRNFDDVLSQAEVKNFLADNQLGACDKDISYLFDTYGINCGFRLSYVSFQKIVLPRTDSILSHRCLGRKVQSISKDEYLPYDIERSLARLIKSEIEFLQKAEALKDELCNKQDFGLMDAFELIDEEKRGCLDFDALYNFLNKNMRTNKADIEALLARFDKNRDQIISYPEFVQILQPINSNKRVPLRSNSPTRKTRVASPKRVEVRITESAYTPVKQKRQVGEDNEMRETAYTNSTAFRSPQNRESSFIEESPNKASFLKDSPSPVKMATIKKEESRFSYVSDNLDVTVKKEWKRAASPTRRQNSVYNNQVFGALENIQRKELARFLKEQVDLDRNCEKIKIELASHRNYNSNAIFRIFDTEGKGYITRGQLEAGLKELNIYPSKTELYLIMRALDKNNDGLIRFAEFKNEIEPKEDGNKSLFDNNKKDNEVSLDLRRLVRKLLNKIISNENSCEELRRALDNNTNFTIFEAFKNLKTDYRVWITTDNFKDLLNEQGIFASNEDANLLLVRYDRNKNGKVSYSEFVDEIIQKLAQ